LREQLLLDFLEGRASASQLGPALTGARMVPEQPGFRSSAHYRVEPLEGSAALGPACIIRLVDALSERALTEDQVATACFLLESSPDRFQWDTDTPEGERVADAVFWLGTPQINYPLNARVLEKIRHYLRTGENTLTDDDLPPLRS